MDFCILSSVEQSHDFYFFFFFFFGKLAHVDEISLIPKGFSPFSHLMEFRFLFTVVFGLFSCGHLIFSNITDLTSLTLLDENST